MINMQWTANVINDSEEKESFEAYVQNNQRLLKRLQEIIEEKEVSINNKETSLESYREAGWSYMQAHINGQKTAYATIKQLTTI